MYKLFILFFTFLTLGQEAHASYNSSHIQFKYCSTKPGCITYRDSASQACADIATANNDSTYTWSVDSSSVFRYPNYTCTITAKNAAGVISGSSSFNAYIQFLCNDGSVTNEKGGDGNQFWGVCADSTNAPAGPKCATASGSSVSWTQARGHSANPNAAVPDAGTVGAYPTSSPTCGLKDVPDVTRCYSVKNAAGGIDFFCTFTGVSDGTNASAASAPTDAGTPPANSTPAQTSTSADSKGRCPGGTAQAGVDSSGIPICVGSGTNPSQSSNTSTTTPPSTTTTAADGTKTTTSSQSTTNSDGSVTTTTTTTVVSPDGTVKTSTSVNTGNNPIGGSGKSDSAKDFCSAHPELTICQNSSVSGSCGQVSCQGDAIQCATLRAAAAMQCAQQQDIDALKAMPQKALGDQIMAGADPMAGQISDTLKGTDVDMSRVSFDQSGFLAGGTCLANRSFVVLGQTVPVDFTSVCNNIAPLRAVMMAVALIMAYLIVGRSVVGS